MGRSRCPTHCRFLTSNEGPISSIYAPRGKKQGAALITVIADFQEIAALTVFQRIRGKVVEDQDSDSGEFHDCVRAVAREHFVQKCISSRQFVRGKLVEDFNEVDWHDRFVPAL